MGDAGTVEKRPPVTPDELRKHSVRGDAWIVIRDVVYDVSRFADHHPGGAIIYHFAGRDATEVFEANHVTTNPVVRAKLRHQRLAVLDRSAGSENSAGPAAAGSAKARGKKPAQPLSQKPEPAQPLSQQPEPAQPLSPAAAAAAADRPPAVRPLTPLEADYRAAHDAIRAEGLYDASPLFYAGKVAVVLGFMAACLAVTLSPWCRAHWWAPWVAGVFLSQFWHQSAFIVHDALHNAITHVRKIDQVRCKQAL
jgi:predicted heme/steroid binding protein